LHFSDLRIFAQNFSHEFFSEFKDLLRSYPPSKLARFQEDYTLKSSMFGKVAIERLVDQEKANKQLFPRIQGTSEKLCSCSIYKP
jgi:hypothetical protein